MRVIMAVLVGGLTGVLGAHVAGGQVIVQPGQGVVGTSLSVSTLTTGTVLDVRGVSISADRRYVTMNLRIQQSTLDGIDTFGVGGSLVQVPRVSTVAASGMVQVPAGGAGAVGGPHGIGQGGVMAGPGLSGVSTAHAGPVNVGAVVIPSAPPAALTPGERAALDRLNAEHASQGMLPHHGLAYELPSVPGVASPEPPAEARSAGQVVFVENDKDLLAAQAPALRSDKLTMIQAISQLMKATKTSYSLGSRAFRDARIDDKAVLKLDLPAQSLKASLTAILEQGAPGQTMVVLADEKVVSITTQAGADNKIATRTYYMQDLIANSPRWLDKRTDLGTLRPAKDGEKPAPRRSTGSGSIMELIVGTVRPEIWKVNGGKVGEIYQVNDQVTITAPLSVHAVLDGPKHHNPNQAPLYINYGPGMAPVAR